MTIGPMNILLPLVAPHDVDIYTKSRCLIDRCVKRVIDSIKQKPLGILDGGTCCLR
uniref:Uncharacterized protein n=1 Tax=Helianthus annuus TaxID=4232 RepID=A0A251USA7_HELAN